jgi:hypothetical protein
MRGQNYNITGYWNKVPDQKISTYANTIQGKSLKSPIYKAKIIDLEHTSLGGSGGAMPDPQTMKLNSTRRDKFSSDLKTMRGKFFGYTGDNWN